MGQCKVCESPEIVAMVDDLLDRGTFLDTIQLKLSQLDPAVLIHRSSIHRHKKRHYLPRLRLRLAEKTREPGRRLLVQWPDLPAFAEVAGKVTDADTGAAVTAGASDVLITVSFEECPRKATLKLDPPPEQETDHQLVPALPS